MPDEPPTFDTVSEQIAQKLRQEIIRGHYLPGERLNQTAIGRRFHVSRMPVRDALHTLEAEGLVTLHPRQGARIASIDLARSEKIYQIREVLEVWALERSIPLMTGKHLTRIRKISRVLESIQGAKDVSAWLEIDREFHLAMYTPLDNEELLEIIVELWNATQQLRRAYCMLPGALARAYAHHVQLMEAIEAGDAERAGAVEREHIRQTLRAVSSHLDEQSEGDAA